MALRKRAQVLCSYKFECNKELDCITKTMQLNNFSEKVNKKQYQKR